MTTKEKAKQLVSINSVTILSVIGNKLTMDEVKEIAKQCALVEVDEILDTLNHDISGDILLDLIHYWQEVKQEI